MSLDIKKEFDSKANKYETYRLSDWYKAQCNFVLPHLLKGSGYVLDIGCGTGWLLRQLAKNNPETIGIGVDLSDRMIERARELAHLENLKNIQFLSGDWEDSTTVAKVRNILPQPASSAVCVSSFHYFKNPSNAVRNIANLLAHNGALLILDRAMDKSPLTFVWSMVHRYLLWHALQFYHTDEIITTLSESGFVGIQRKGEIKKFFWKGKIYSSLVLVAGYVNNPCRCS